MRRLYLFLSYLLVCYIRQVRKFQGTYEELDEHNHRPVSSKVVPKCTRKEVSESPLNLLLSLEKSGATNTSQKNDTDLGPTSPSEHLAPKEDWLRGELFQEMGRFVRTQRSAHTRRAYNTDLKQFISWLRTERYSPGIDALLEYRDWLVRPKNELGAGLSRSSANRKFATVRSFLSWLQGRGFMKENPAIWIKNFRAKTESPTQGFSDAQVARTLDMASRFTRSGLQHSVILHILFYMGLRRSEIVAIRCSHFGQQRVEEDVVTTLRVQGKGDKERVLPVPEKALEVLELYMERNNLAIGMDRYLFRAVKCNVPSSVFQKVRNSKIEDSPLNTNTIAYIVKKYAKKAGIDAQVSPHSCRATCISNALDQGATHRSVQQMAGWSSPLMIERYDKRHTSLKDSAVHIVRYP